MAPHPVVSCPELAGDQPLSDQQQQQVEPARRALLQQVAEQLLHRRLQLTNKADRKCSEDTRKSSGRANWVSAGLLSSSTEREESSQCSMTVTTSTMKA
ncbi:hypothetical protein EYF80_061457 [Liparis tanakae]|uniref:Uncharacterized protein n=1 Tax=Liparis tanakae TaxID=230148 RepID=A0A4Z2EHU0_9TELE|nr:hypothetical protein EYF80_061457 [Liparis tanakae]